MREHFTCCVFLRSELQVQGPAVEVGNCPNVEEAAPPPVPNHFPVSRYMNPLSDAKFSSSPHFEQGVCLVSQVVMRPRNSLFFNSVRSPKTVPVPTLHLEFGREDDWLLCAMMRRRRTRRSLPGATTTPTTAHNSSDTLSTRSHAASSIATTRTCRWRTMIHQGPRGSWHELPVPTRQLRHCNHQLQ